MILSNQTSLRHLLLAAAAVLTPILLVFFYLSADPIVSSPIRCSTPQIDAPSAPSAASAAAADEATETILHYATSSITPQQSASEIRVSLDVLKRRRPCNFLVFGLGHDSRMWSAFNAGGRTLFLEEDPSWFRNVLKGSPHLRANTVDYPTRLKDADGLLRSYRQEELCLPPAATLKGNRRCRLALADLPDEVYETEWDLIMIDAPRGYFPEAPGRMGAIWTAAVMARNRRREGDTDVFLHDIDRKVEKEFALEFLCAKNRVDAVGRLWHFRIPAARGGGNTTRFC